MVLINLLFLELIHAEVKLPALISSNMVLQCDTTIKLWGWADSFEKVYINTSWLKKKISIEANQDGTWFIEVKTNNSKEPQIIQIKSETSNITLENILFGEVWLCSGQSNMQQPIKGFMGQPTYESSMVIAKSSNSNLRLFSLNQIGSKIPLKDIEDSNS